MTKRCRKKSHSRTQRKLFKSRRHFGEIILISRNEELYISKGAKKENALASEGKSCRPEKINMRFTSCQYEIYLISGQNSQLLTENVLLQSIIYPTEKTIHWNKQHFCMRWKSCVSYRSPFFSQARKQWRSTVERNLKNSLHEPHLINEAFVKSCW